MRKDHGHLGASEIAVLLGVSRPRVHQIADTYPDFPVPVADLHMGKVWHAADVEAWAAEHPNRTVTTRIHRSRP